MSYPYRFLSPSNFELAFHRLVRSGNREYKQFFRPLFPSYELGLRANVLDLVESIKTGSYEPAEPELVFLPKTSGVLRPLTVLSLTDLMVYQAICNVVADAFQRKDLRRAGRVSFGNIYAGKSSKFLYRSWKRSYATFRRAIRTAFESGRTWVADFDLVSFFELIDHELLIQVVKTRIANEEFLGLLKKSLSRWTLGRGTNQIRHGLPQGPDASALFADIFLQSFDDMRFKDCTYFRYVDDIKLLSVGEVPVRRALVSLDLKSKALGLVPQAEKIECRQITRLRDLYKTVPSGLLVTAGTERTQKPARGEALLKAVRRSISGRSKAIRVVDDTLFKFALYRSPPRKRLLRRIAPLFLSRPDLSWVLATYATKFGRDPPVARLLLNAVDRDPVFDAAAASYIRAMDACEPRPTIRGYRRAVQTARRRSQEKGALLSVEAVLFRARRRPSSLRALVRHVRSAIAVAPILSRLLAEDERRWASAIRPICEMHLSNSNADLARFAAACLLGRGWLPHPLPKATHHAAQLLLAALGVIKKAPKREGILSKFFQAQNISTRVRWAKVFGPDLPSVEHRCVRLQTYMASPDPSSLILLLDTFNECFVQQVSSRDQKIAMDFKKCCKHGHKQPDYGQWLKLEKAGGGSRLATVLPKAQPWLLGVHAARLRADLAHAKDKAGRPTRPITFKEAERLMRGRQIAWAEILGKLSKA